MTDNREPENEIDLPFEESKFDLGLWVYRHQVGLCITLGIYLIFIFVLLFGQISLKNRKLAESVEIDLQTLAELEAIRDRLQESIEMINKESAEIEDISNRISNENIESDKFDEKPMNIQELLDQAAELQNRMAADRASYESGLAEIAEMKRQANELSSVVDTTRTIRQDVKVQGNVTVSYSLINPIRHATRLDVPAYLCEGGGEVKVQIFVERSGVVTGAKILQPAADDCINQSALQAALRTEFNISRVAPVKHQGVITYRFVAQ